MTITEHEYCPLASPGVGPAVPTKGSRLTAAELCRANGWGPGTRLVGEETASSGWWCQTVIEVTAVGRAGVFAARLAQRSGTPGCSRWQRDAGENSWSLSDREWRPVGAGEWAAIRAEAGEGGAG